MTWTDERGVTHAVSTYVNEHGSISILTDRTDMRYANLDGGGWMRCTKRAPPGSENSMHAVDCMTCLVKGAT